jgi:hypothetical protein
MSRKQLTLILFLIALALSACAPIATTPVGPGGTVPAGAASEATVAAPATPPPTSAASPVATVAGAGATFAGTIRHAGQPLGGARIELRPFGWATTGAAPVASATADANGMFTLPNPPAGDWSVVGFFPDGEIDAGGWPPVSIAPGQAVLGFVVPLERKISLLEPIGGVTVSATPTFAWQPAPGAASYRVWVIDAGTTELVVNQTVTGTKLAPGPLPTGRPYQWVVNALDASGNDVATASETFQVAAESAATPVLPTAAEANGLPPSCQPVAGQFAAFGAEDNTFCFRYPDRFQAVIPEGTIDAVGMVVGPALDASPDPLRATLLVEAKPAEGLDLAGATAALLDEFAGMPGVTISQQPIDLGGAPAVLLEGVPGRGGSRDILTVRDGVRLRLLFMPDPAGFPTAKPDLDELFAAVTQSFTFLAAPESASQPETMPRLPDRERAFAAARAALAARLGIDELSIRLVDATPQQWNDACLGVSRAGQMCAQVITPGWLILMETGGRQYEAHTDQEGAQVRLVDAG